VPLTGAYGGSGGSNDGGAGPAASSSNAASTDGDQLGKVRDKYMVFCLDSSDTLGRLGKLFTRKGRVLTDLAAAGHSVGLAVCSAFSLQDTVDILQGKGISLADLDFAVTSCGAEVWYCRDAGKASGGAGKASGASTGNNDACVLDDEYDAKLDLCWDALSVRRVLNQCMGQLLRQQAAATAASGSLAKASINSSTASAGGLNRRSSLSMSLPRCKISVEAAGAGHHLMVSLEAADSGGMAPAGAYEGGSGSGSGSSGSASASEPALGAHELSLLISRVKRRLRKSGLRAQVIAQQDGAATKLHILPVRGSRALALRHLTYRHRVDMSSLVLVTCAKDLAPTGAGGGVAKFACSDAEELVSGVQGVLVLPPPPGAAGDGFPVDLDLFTHDGRVQLLPGM
jgi:hypothetical protein